MGLYDEQTIVSAAVTASSVSAAVKAIAGAVQKPPLTRAGYSSGLFVQEITAVSSLTSWDEKVQFKFGTMVSNADLLDHLGNLVAFPTTAVAGLAMKLVNGVIPANLYTKYTIVGTSATRSVNFALGG